MSVRVQTPYPGYDVLRKRDTPSWDDVTRRVVDDRIAVSDEPRFFDAAQWRAVQALCVCVVPQDDTRLRVPLAAMLDRKLQDKTPGDGYRDARLPPMHDAWRRGVDALDAESHALHDLPFGCIGPEARVALLHRMQQGDLHLPVWRGMPPALFFSERVLHDICGLYYSHPDAWSEIGFGGPANPRGYVRLVSNRRDPWEPREQSPGQENETRKENQRVR